DDRLSSVPNTSNTSNTSLHSLLRYPGSRSSCTSSDGLLNSAAKAWSQTQDSIREGTAEGMTHPDGTKNIPGTCIRKAGRLSVQESYEPQGTSFGSGIHNPVGLHLRSYRSSEGLESLWKAEKHHEAFPGVVAGAVISGLFECQCSDFVRVGPRLTGRVVPRFGFLEAGGLQDLRKPQNISVKGVGQIPHLPYRLELIHGFVNVASHG
ncbi:hypothetical protein CYMTET_19208, partial [Cymbomonas tetramitiformis]